MKKSLWHKAVMLLTIPVPPPLPTIVEREECTSVCLDEATPLLAIKDWGEPVD